MHRTALSLLCSVGLLTSCDTFGPEDVQVLLRTDAASYVAPARVGVRLVNVSAGTLWHGVCLGLERREGDEWVWVEPDELVPCPAVLLVTKAWQQRELGAHVEEPGEYRLLLWVSTSNDERVDRPFISNAFTVEPDTD